MGMDNVDALTAALATIASESRAFADGCTGPEQEDLLMDLFAPSPASHRAGHLATAAAADAAAAWLPFVRGRAATKDGILLLAEREAEEHHVVLMLAHARAEKVAIPRSSVTDIDADAAGDY